MNKTGFMYDERYLLHDTGKYHPEMPDRLRAITKGLEEGGLMPSLVPIKAVKARQRWIEAVHDIRYVMRFEETCLMGLSEFDYPDNQMCAASYDVAMLAVGGVLDVVDRVMKGELDNAFCAVRPPGHHAERDKAMGFCYFNNVAIAANYLRETHNISRVGIIDFDVHHGNGTQHIFEEDPNVFYYSIHEHPSFMFPGTGREFETGKGPGEGFTLNSPMLPGQGDKEYKEAVRRDLLPAFDAFKPEIILISAGFDAHEDDEMSNIRLSTDGFTWIMEQIMALGKAHAAGRVISVLEGGYSLHRLPELVKNHVEILLEK